MPDYAPNFSPRFVATYRHVGSTHALSWRLARGATVDTVANVSKLGSVLRAAQQRLYADFSVTGITYYPQDEFTGIPVSTSDLGAISPVQSLNNSDPAQKAVQARWEARGNTGTRGAFVLFGLFRPQELGVSGYAADFRVTAAEDATVAAIATALSELSPAWIPLGATGVVWRTYANVKVNDKWLKRIRRGI